MEQCINTHECKLTDTVQTDILFHGSNIGHSGHVLVEVLVVTHITLVGFFFKLIVIYIIGPKNIMKPTNHIWSFSVIHQLAHGGSCIFHFDLYQMKYFRCQQLVCDNSRVNDTSHPVLAFQIAQTDAAVASRREVAHLVIFGNIFHEGGHICCCCCFAVMMVLVNKVIFSCRSHSPLLIYPAFCFFLNPLDRSHGPQAFEKRYSRVFGWWLHSSHTD